MALPSSPSTPTEEPVPAHRRGFLVGDRFSDDMSRVISLSDGVFAFALTLLVLSLVVPVVPGTTNGVTNGPLGAALNHDYGTFIGYVFAFVMIAVWWINHHRLFRYIVRTDDLLIWINLALLLEVAVMPFVLKVYTTYDFTQYGIILFAAMQAVAGFTMNILWRYAAGVKLLRPDLDPAIIRFHKVRGLFTPAVFLISIAVSFVSLGAAEGTWIFVFVAQRFAARAVFTDRTTGQREEETGS